MVQWVANPPLVPLLATNNMPISPPATPALFPEKLQCLFQPKRYKVLYGGRGAGRSWGCARALLIEGTRRAIRVLCARELQNSLDESVHQLLEDQIGALGLGEFYRVEKAKIYGRNGTEFSFEGIKNNTTKIKSYEGVDYCWVEEAVKVSRRSWGILIPTIRKAGSEIWLTFNPELEDDYTYRRFVLEAASDEAFVVKMTWRDNPWFGQTALADEMSRDRTRDPDYYLNVWEGFPIQVLEGAIFAKELRRAQQERRITKVPWESEVPVDTFWDLGRRDMTSIWFAQRVAMQYRILGYFEDSAEDIHYYLRHCQTAGYTYGTFWLPHDARAKRLGERRSIEQIVRGAGYRVQVVERVSRKVNAINAARLLFPQCWFDESECADGLARLRKYRYRVVEGQLSEEPLHDENSNGADAFMTMAQALKGPGAPRPSLAARMTKAKSALVDLAPGLGWMA